MNTLYEHLYIHLWYLAEFFLEWEMFRSKVVGSIKTHFLSSITFFPRKSCRLWDHVEKYGRARQAADDDITRHMRFEFCITTAMLLLGKKLLLECASTVHLYVHCIFCFQVVIYVSNSLTLCLHSSSLPSVLHSSPSHSTWFACPNGMWSPRRWP